MHFNLTLNTIAKVRKQKRTGGGSPLSTFNKAVKY